MRGKSTLFSIAVLVTLLLFLTVPAPIASLLTISIWSAVLLFQNSILCVTRGVARQLGVYLTLNTQAVSANITTPSAGVDLINFDSAMFVAQSGAVVASGIAAPAAYESDDNVSWSLVAASDLHTPFTNFTAANQIQKVGYLGTKRYIGLGAAYVSGTSIVITGMVVAGNAHVAAVP
jgi:hypothetical protein